MRCRRCKKPAVVEVRRHNAAFCDSCFQAYVHAQVRKAVDGLGMFSCDERILVAVSGGKDSLALWDILISQGYRVDGLYLGLGVGEYSKRSQRACEAFASERRVNLRVYDTAIEEGYDVPRAAKGPRTPCSVCGLAKRHLFNRLALEGGYDVVATGHNLDDEAAVLLGNVLRWETGYLARQKPVLQSTHPGLARKVKPLYRVAERETAAYAVLRDIDYVVQECPLAVGNTQIELKHALDAIEETSPGTKHAFLFGFLERAAKAFEGEDAVELHACSRCDMPTGGALELCAYCRMRDSLTGSRGPSAEEERL